MFTLPSVACATSVSRTLPPLRVKSHPYQKVTATVDARSIGRMPKSPTTHAWRYGFVVRYPADTRRATGYQAEPWRVRYVGAPPARELRRSGVTLEEFFDVRPGT